MTNWRTIDTAPKDETVVDLLFADGLIVRGCYWLDFPELEMGSWRAPDGDRIDEADDPTHWTQNSVST